MTERMRNDKGFYVAIEGGDGSGKATQTKILVEKLQDEGYWVLKTSYPQYGNPSARYVERYLNGSYGSANDVPADLAALTYVIDRVDHSTLAIVRAHLALPDGVVVSDRSPASNMAHQGTKFETFEQRQQFYKEILELEYNILAEPEPDLNIVLRVPADIAQQNVDKKDARSYTDLKRDIHEADATHLNKALRGYEELCELFPNKFVSIQALDEERGMRSIEDVHEEIMSLLYARNILTKRIV
ncbi:deoxynucleoside kinase [Microbacteriaceae bacterium]|nr:deoxynucleoside kinase [Candidatus Saccharibacteria bacterium]